MVAEQALGLMGMMIPVVAGILSALRRVIARRVSLKVILFQILFIPSTSSFAYNQLYSFTEPAKETTTCDNHYFCNLFSVSFGHVGPCHSKWYYLFCSGVFLFGLLTSLLQGSSSGKAVELPFSAWAFLATIVFGIILIFYVDNIAEERFP